MQKKMTFLWLILIVWCAKTRITATQEHTYIFERGIAAPDGIFSRPVITVNGIFPGPALHAALNQWLSITVINNLAENELLSVHWHGILQTASPYSDGTAGITK